MTKQPQCLLQISSCYVTLFCSWKDFPVIQNPEEAIKIPVVLLDVTFLSIQHHKKHKAHLRFRLREETVAQKCEKETAEKICLKIKRKSVILFSLESFLLVLLHFKHFKVDLLHCTHYKVVFKSLFCYYKSILATKCIPFSS